LALVLVSLWQVSSNVTRSTLPAGSPSSSSRSRGHVRAPRRRTVTEGMPSMLREDKTLTNEAMKRSELSLKNSGAMRGRASQPSISAFVTCDLMRKYWCILGEVVAEGRKH
jgi:hypothetical protein